MTDRPQLDSWIDSPSPEDFGSVPPSPEQLRREQRASAYKRAYEEANPEETICFLDIWSPRFADENWTEEQIRKNANAGVNLLHNVVTLLENIATDAAELANEYADTGDVSHDRLEMLTRPLADVERSSLLAHAEAGRTPDGYETRWLSSVYLERMLDALGGRADQYIGVHGGSAEGVAHVKEEIRGQWELWASAHEDEEDAPTPVTLFLSDWEIVDEELEDFNLDRDEDEPTREVSPQ
jgi:hypothetical protein